MEKIRKCLNFLLIVSFGHLAVTAGNPLRTKNDRDNFTAKIQKREVSVFGANLQEFYNTLEGHELELLDKPLNISSLKHLRKYLREAKYTGKGYICSRLDLESLKNIEQELQSCQTNWLNLYESLNDQLSPRDKYRLVKGLGYRIFEHETVFQNERGCNSDGGFPFSVPKGKNFELLSEVLSIFNKPNAIICIYINKFSQILGTFHNTNQISSKLLQKVGDQKFQGYIVYRPSLRMEDQNVITIATNANAEVLINNKTYPVLYICQYSRNSQWGQNKDLDQILYSHLKKDFSRKRRSAIPSFVQMKTVIARIVSYIDTLKKTIGPKQTPSKQNCLIKIDKNAFPHATFTCPSAEMLNKQGDFQQHEAHDLIKNFIQFIDETGNFHSDFIDALKDLKRIIPASAWQKLNNYFEKFSLSLPQNSVFLATMVISVIVTIYTIVLTYYYCKLRFSKEHNGLTIHRRQPPTNPYRAVSQQTGF